MNIVVNVISLSIDNLLQTLGVCPTILLKTPVDECDSVVSEGRNITHHTRFDSLKKNLRKNQIKYLNELFYSDFSRPFSKRLQQDANAEGGYMLNKMLIFLSYITTLYIELMQSEYFPFIH